MKKILVPIDFSDCSLNALKYAVNLAKSSNQQLLVLHAVQVPAIAGGEVPGQEIESEVKEEYKIFQKRIPELEEVSHEFQFSFDFLITSIRKLSKEIDMIVMGTTGASGIKEALIGSNTFDVIKDLEFPVIAIPENTETLSMGTIAFASDYKQIENTSDIKPLIELSKLQNNDIHILHIGESNNISREELAVGKSQEQLFKGIRHSYHFINGSDIVEEITRYLENNGIKLLAIYARKHTLTEKIFHKSVTKEMAFHSKVPVLVLPERN